jgi:MFS-type transporter involved in bile tolerance (Atg22 family)
MSVFASAATNRSQPVSKVYTTAAAMIDLTCGALFVNSSIPVNPSTGAASAVGKGLGGLGSVALLLALITVLV